MINTPFHQSIISLSKIYANLLQDTQFAQEPLSNRPSESARASDKTLEQRPGDVIRVNVSGDRRQTGRSGDEFAPPPPATKPKKFSGFIFLGGAPNLEEFTEDGKLALAVSYSAMLTHL